MRQTVLLVFVDHNSEAKYRCEKKTTIELEKKIGWTSMKVNPTLTGSWKKTNAV